MTEQKRWRDLYNDLVRQVDDGRLAPGDKLPTEAQLREDYGLGRHSVREALQQLEAQGIISPARGPQGREVLRYAPRLWDLTSFEVGERRDDPDVGDDWAAGIREQGETPHETVEVSPELPTADIATYLQVTTGTWMIRRRRYRYAGPELVSIADTWILDEVAKLPATTPSGEVIYPFMTRESTALPGGFIRAVGVKQSWVEDRHFARRPTLDEAGALDIRLDEPVSEVVRIGYRGDDGDLSPFRVLHTVSPGRALAPRYWLRIQHP